MKEIREEIRREVVDTHIYYEAIDGTRFTNKEECEKYDNSAIAVLMAKTLKFTARELDASTIEWLDTCDEHGYRTLLPTTAEDIDVLNQLWFSFEGSNRKDEEAKFSIDDLNHVILMGYRQYESNMDWVWFYKMEDVVNDLTNGKFQLTSKAKVK
jgi:hypothetical protein